MFILTKIADLVQIRPDNFEKPSHIAIEDSINAKYANRVIQKIGLCICMYDLLWASEGLIGHGSGMVNVNVEFRMIVFRPFKGETIFGRISEATQDGIHIRTDFFEDIFVEYKELPENTQYNHNEKAWTWIYDPDGDPMWYDKNEMVRLQVIEEEWHDQTPESAEEEAVDKAKKLSPYRIKGTMMKEGLGVCLWWE
ncbi:RNA polymerase III subunit Rpc25-domain-containing protein [Daldinia caldariorum]|uniref:RNA polymerase III subunit Rpc25-domain-containing protein n=1 Tax=Daldinia caldariorum TaxID=326644 RepID=UPI0020081163|nr:RNA polymerase III subunit Rpc25-domain-containing protein [Daldinia caldariorum]KAI1467479.1 RNA polymerase III subunit Rpc25-domain-containing protein [Daldinia caldariorum]